MKKIFCLSALLMCGTTNAQKCDDLFLRSPKAIIYGHVNPKDIKFKYKAPLFGASAEIEMYFKNKLIVSFSSKSSAENSIATDYNHSLYSSTREAFYRTTQSLTNKLLWMERNYNAIRIDFTKLVMKASSSGVCWTDVQSLNFIIIENEILDHPVEKVVLIPEASEPDRSFKVELVRSKDRLIDSEPTR